MIAQIIQQQRYRMNECKIFIKNLEGGQTEQLEGVLDPSFLDIHESYLLFKEPIHYQGETYLADDHLIIHLNIKTNAELPCSICNKLIQVPIVIADFYHTELLTELNSHIFDFTGPLRETILLAVPPFTECNNGNCLERGTISQYFKKEKTDPSAKENIYFPFADL